MGESPSGFAERPFLDPEDPSFYGLVAGIATKGSSISGLASASAPCMITLRDGEAAVFAGTSASLSKKFDDLIHYGMAFSRQSGAGLALVVNRTGSKARSVRNFALSAKAVAAAKLHSTAHVGGVSNMISMSKTYAKTFTAVQVAALSGQQIAGTAAVAGLVEYWDTAQIDFDAVFNKLVECGLINRGIIKRPSKLRSFFSKEKEQGINFDFTDEFSDDDL